MTLPYIEAVACSDRTQCNAWKTEDRNGKDVRHRDCNPCIQVFPHGGDNEKFLGNTRLITARYRLMKGANMVVCESHSYEIRYEEHNGKYTYVMYIPATGEIRECDSLLPLFRTIVQDFGSDEKLRKG